MKTALFRSSVTKTSRFLFKLGLGRDPLRQTLTKLHWRLLPFAKFWHTLIRVGVQCAVVGKKRVESFCCDNKLCLNTRNRTRVSMSSEDPSTTTDVPGTPVFCLASCNNGKGENELNKRARGALRTGVFSIFLLSIVLWEIFAVISCKVLLMALSSFPVVTRESSYRRVHYL